MDYEAVIGLEVHVQVRTNSKMFCRCENRYGASANSLVCPVCLGHPGVLPVPNEEAIHRTIGAGLMCDCQIAAYSKFDRKSYFYPDMPKNYQISQYDLPLCEHGHISIGGKGLTGGDVDRRDIGITRIHLEEDVAKSTHFTKESGIDFNRAGVPLMEIVSEPDMRTPDEAYVYLTALKQVMEYAGISDCDMEKGQMRCDANISIRPHGSDVLNTKIEVKNLNSFKAVHHALQYEIKRQARVVDDGGALSQETRGWNDGEARTYLLRSKESAHDYRYFPDPDLMPMNISTDQIDAIRKGMPETPQVVRHRFITDYALPEYDAGVLTAERGVAIYFEAVVAAGAAAKTASNWIMTELLRELGQAGIDIDQCPVAPEALAALTKMVKTGTINGSTAKTVFSEMFSSGRGATEIIEEKGLTQISDTDSIQDWVTQVIAEHPGPIEQYRSGKSNAFQFLVGQVMRLSRGKANPQLVNEALKEKLDV